MSLFSNQPFGILTGNELLLRGALECEVDLLTGYPGSPLAEFFSICEHYQQDFNRHGAKVVIANSEANAAAMGFGAKMSGVKTLMGMKSMGLHVASDPLSVGNFAQVNDPLHQSAVVIVVGDDPWSISTSTPADSRFLFKHLTIPFLIPSSPVELKNLIHTAFRISQETGFYIGVVLTTHLAEGGGLVPLCPIRQRSVKKVTLNTKEFDLKKQVMVPPHSYLADQEMHLVRMPQLIQYLENNPVNTFHGNENSPHLLVVDNAVFSLVMEVLQFHQWEHHFHIYKVVMSYPLVDLQLPRVLTHKTHVIVVEEKRGFLESELLAYTAKVTHPLEIWGKKTPDNKNFFPAHGGLNFEIIASLLHSYLSSKNPLKCESDISHQAQVEASSFPIRLPTFCPGCPHRETLSLIKDLRAWLADRGEDLVTHGDVGCYSLSFLPPFKEMHNLSAMGQGGAMASGTDLFTKNPSVVLMGDSTFFHSGMSAISHSVQCNHNITYILLDNDNTAMTGHQVTPRSGVSVEGEIRPRQDLLAIVRGLKVSEAVMVNPSFRQNYREILFETIKKPGTKVIVSNKECALTALPKKKVQERELIKEKGYVPEKVFFQINTQVCEDCRVCVEATGCPGLSQVEDAYGPKVFIDPAICVNDSYCTTLKACPSFEKVVVHQYLPTTFVTPKVKSDLGILSPPSIRNPLGKNRYHHRVLVSGVGGSGVTFLSRVIAELAGSLNPQEFQFQFFDQKGLAQRNGAVVSHINLFSVDQYFGQTNGKNACDLILAPDLLEGVKVVDYLKESPAALMIVDSEMQVPLSLLLDETQDRKTVTRDAIQYLEKSLGKKVFLFPFKDLAHQMFGARVYANSLILGTAYQLGCLPFTEEELKEAFKKVIPAKELAPNIQAFDAGKVIACGEGMKLFADKENIDEVADLRRDVQELFFWKKTSAGLDFDEKFHQLSRLVPSISKAFLARYVRDFLFYDDGKSFSEFIESVKIILKWYPDNSPLLPQVLVLLLKTFIIKDELMVARLMVCPSKEQKDRQRYDNIGRSYKIHPINRPHFDLWGIKFEFDISPPRWLLKIFRYGTFLRKVLPKWHHRENEIANFMRKSLLDSPMTKQSLQQLSLIKGYREVRYQKAASLQELQRKRFGEH